MAGLKPWHQVAVPREDLRAGKPLDAAEFAIHLDQVIDGRAPLDYREPERFFARTYLTEAYKKMIVEVMRRLAGDVVGTSPGINLTTQFGGGKTHFLTLLYHLFKAADRVAGWLGVREILSQAGLARVPRARVAAFIGNRFDFVVGVGAEGEPKRKTPWGDLAWQLGGAELFNLVREHDEKGVVPGGEVLQRVFTGEPTLVLMDEVLSFTRRAREAGGDYARLGSQFYSFLDVFSREVAGTSNVVLVVSLPLSEYEMTEEDEAEFARLDKMLGRLSKPVLLSEQIEIAEIVRRRLFEDPGDSKEVRRTANAYADWVKAHRQQLPEWFPVDQAEKLFEATYPFHPTVISVFERKWQSLPKFQRTRGILRLLALWVSHAYQRAFREASREPLIALGSAPLGDSLFRAAVFEQLGEQRLEAAILSDIAGEEAHAVRMDAEAQVTIKRARLHQKTVTTVLFESSGGQVRNEATLAEIRLAVGEPGLDIGNVETVLEDLVRCCYYLNAKGTAYWISHRPTLNKILADRRAALSGPEADEAIRENVRRTIREVFRPGPGLDRRFFPETSADIPDAPTLVLVVLAPEYGWENASREATQRLITGMIQECGGRGRTFKSGLLFAVAEGGAALADEGKTLLALESLEDPAEQERLKLEPSQIQELREKKQRTERNLKEGVWRVYRRVLLLAEDGGLREVDLGLLHPSAAESLVGLIVARLKQEGLLEESVSSDFLVRNWPPAFAKEWSTKSVRDMFFASPQFPRLLNPEILRATIAEGVKAGKFGYVGKAYGGYQGTPIIEDPNFGPEDVEFSDQVVLLPRDKAVALKAASAAPGEPEREYPVDKEPWVIAEPAGVPIEEPVTSPVSDKRCLSWEGELPPQKWTNFYMKVLTRFATDPSLRLRIRFEVAPEAGISQPQLEEVKMALRELGLDAERLKAEGSE
ncbi:MAG TPA: ATP-binding protein [Firmicutes bacterium]|nr:ATP-binding protein [Candidatus Fermentithermobacillaceae bacterium]